MVTSEKKNWKKDWRCVDTTEKHVKNRETGEKQIGSTKTKTQKSGRKKTHWKHIIATNLSSFDSKKQKGVFVNPGLVSGDNRWQQSFEGNAQRATWHLSIHSPSYYTPLTKIPTVLISFHTNAMHPTWTLSRWSTGVSLPLILIPPKPTQVRRHVRLDS